MIKHKSVDELSDAMREIFEVVEMNLKYIPAKGLVRNTPLAEINKQLNSATRNLITKSTDIISNVEGALQIDLSGIKKANASNIKQVSSQVRLKRTDVKRQELVKAISQGIEHQTTVTTKSGRKWGYKEYMEMSIRTELAHEMGEMMLEAGAGAGVVFYLCNEFEDCADDHKEYQGRYYYDMNFKQYGYDNKMIEKIIRDKKVLPLQYMRENKPYITTRPNCRHTMTPVSIEQVSGVSPRKMLDDLKLTTGTYKDTKTLATQEMRYNERQIRHYKQLGMMYERLASEATDVDRAQELKELARHNNRLTRQWQARRRQLVKNNPHLKYDVRRETSGRILPNLGVEYNLESLLDVAAVENIEKTAKAVKTRVFNNPSISKTAEQVLDIDDVKYTGFVDGFRNKAIRDWAEPAVQSMVNTFPDLADALGKHIKFERKSIRSHINGQFVRSYGLAYQVRDGFKIKADVSVLFNTKEFYDLDHLRHKKDRMFEIGWSSSGHEQGTIIHELAHAFDYLMSAKMLGLDLNDLDKTYKTREDAMVVVGKYRRASNLLFSRGIRDDFDDMDIKKEIGEYATTNYRETFAEMFTKWFLSDNPDGEFEQRFGKWLGDKIEEVNENANK